MDKLTNIEICIRNTKQQIEMLEHYLEKLEAMKAEAIIEEEVDEELRGIENESM